ncbi:MAG: succinate dehydrogenase assembly factor 4 [Pseudomonadota bacterium]
MSTQKKPPHTKPKASDSPADNGSTGEDGDKPKEIGGPKGLEPTRYGDWERKGRCIDF